MGFVQTGCACLLFRAVRFLPVRAPLHVRMCAHVFERVAAWDFVQEIAASLVGWLHMLLHPVPAGGRDWGPPRRGRFLRILPLLRAAFYKFVGRDRLLVL